MSTAATSARVSVVTGAAGGIGTALCVRLAERGDTVVGIDVVDPASTGVQVRAAGARWSGLVVDLTDETAIAAAAAQVQSSFGRCDVLVNNAAIEDPVSFDDLTVERWRHVVRTDLDAPFLLAKAFVPMMRAGGSGRIVNVATGSVMNPMPQFVAYRAAKMGLIGLTRALATELGRDGITVNAVSPGMTRTRMTEESLPDGALEAAAEARPIPRVALPEDIVGAIAFLSGDDAAFITGQTLLVNGGTCFL